MPGIYNSGKKNFLKKSQAECAYCKETIVCKSFSVTFYTVSKGGTFSQVTGNSKITLKR